MIKYNCCLTMAQYCKYANIFGDCRINNKKCNETPFILNDDYSDEYEDYLDYDLFEEDL